MKVPVTVQDSRRRFVELVTPQIGHRAGADLAVRLRGFAAAGGDLMMARTGTKRPVLVLTSWPEEHAAARVPGIAGLRERVVNDEDCEPVEMHNVHGYAVLRVPSPDGLEGRPRMLYWVSDPERGRVLCVDVTYFGQSARDDEAWTEPYDLLAEHLRWKESTHED